MTLFRLTQPWQPSVQLAVVEHQGLSELSTVVHAPYDTVPYLGRG